MWASANFAGLMVFSRTSVTLVGIFWGVDGIYSGVSVILMEGSVNLVGVDGIYSGVSVMLMRGGGGRWT